MRAVFLLRSACARVRLRVRPSFMSLSLCALTLCGAVDHILFIKKDVELKLNKNEVAATDYVTAEQLRKMIEDRSQRV